VKLTYGQPGGDALDFVFHWKYSKLKPAKWACASGAREASGGSTGVLFGMIALTPVITTPEVAPAYPEIHTTHTHTHTQRERERERVTRDSLLARGVS
jgi:hypothetical protein